MLRLEGTRSGRDAVGARVVVESGGRRQSVMRSGGGSYLSASDSRIHIGIGDRSRAESVEVTWPSGHKDRFEDLEADTGYFLREGQAVPQPLVGFGVKGIRPAP